MRPKISFVTVIHICEELNSCKVHLTSRSCLAQNAQHLCRNVLLVHAVEVR